MNFDSAHVAPITFLGLRMKTREARVKQVLGSHFKSVIAYDKPCLEWQLRTKNGQYLTIIASFAKKRLMMLSVWLGK